MSRRTILIALTPAYLFIGEHFCVAAQVSYSGRVFHFDSPVSNGYVVAGTFAPGFNPGSYPCVYGDFVCNLAPQAYDSAVADGNFLPIGPGVLTDASGTFTGSGSTNAAAGTPIWLFAFQDNTRDSFFQALASSTDSSWLVPAQPSGTTAINASVANQFVMGESHPQGVSLTVIPFPEPASAWLLTVGALAALVNGRHRFKRRD